MINNTPNFTKIITEHNNQRNVLDNYKSFSSDELKEFTDNNRLDYSVILLNMTGDLNIGSIIRSSVMFGVKEVFIIGRKKFDKRSTVGSENYINIKYYTVDNPLDISKDYFMNIVNEHNLLPIFVELTTNSKIIGNFKWNEYLDNIGNKTPCLIMGNEQFGISDDILSCQNEIQNSFSVMIKQLPPMRSLNASNAFNIVAYNLFMNYFN